MEELNSFVGTSGHTSDKEFDLLIDVIDMNDDLKLEDYYAEEAYYTKVITEIYVHAKTKERYELWYQVRTPNSLNYMEFAYGFDIAE